MKKQSSKIREEITRLQEQLRQAETREAERIGRIALKAGLGEIQVDDAKLQTAFEQLAFRLREGEEASRPGNAISRDGTKGSEAPTFGPEPHPSGSLET